jgi:hypothetical protein
MPVWRTSGGWWGEIGNVTVSRRQPADGSEASGDPPLAGRCERPPRLALVEVMGLYSGVLVQHGGRDAPGAIRRIFYEQLIVLEGVLGEVHRHPEPGIEPNGLVGKALRRQRAIHEPGSPERKPANTPPHVPHDRPIPKA